MKALPAFVLALAVTGLAPSASADDTAVFAQLGVGGTGVYGELGNSFDSQLTRSSVGLGARWKGFSLSMDLNFDFRASSEPELHSSSLVGLQYGPELRRFFLVPRPRRLRTPPGSATPPRVPITLRCAMYGDCLRWFVGGGPNTLSGSGATPDSCSMSRNCFSTS